MVSEGYSGIDVQLKRRHNLIPNLVSTVQGYANFERGVLEDVTRLRSQLPRTHRSKKRRKEKMNCPRRSNICLQSPKIIPT